MRRKQSIIFVLVFIAYSMLLSACGGEAEVPDKYIDYAVQDFVNNKYLLPEREYESYKFSTKHNPDKSSHTDEVEVITQVIYPYGEVIFQARQVYQYSSGNDNWTEMDYWSWKEIDRSIDEKSIVGTWTSNYYGPTYELNIEAIDFNAGTVTCAYSISDTIGYSFTIRGTTQVTYTGHDTFALEGSSNDYRFIISETDQSYYVELSVEHGVNLGRWG